MKRGTATGRAATVTVLAALACGPSPRAGEGGGGGSGGAEDSPETEEASASQSSSSSTTDADSSSGEPTDCPQLTAPSFSIAYTGLGMATVSFVAGDVNGDPWPDLVFDGPQGAEIWFGSASGLGIDSNEPHRPDFQLPRGATRLRLARLYGGAHADLAFLDPANGVGVARGDGAGEFAAPEFLDLPAMITAFEAGDLDGDGRAELVAAGSGTVIVVADVGGENQIREFPLDLEGVDDLFISSAQPAQVYVAGYTGETALFAAALGDDEPTWTGFPRMLLHYGDMAIVDVDGAPTFFGIEGLSSAPGSAVRAELDGDPLASAQIVDAGDVAFDPQIEYVGFAGGYDAVVLDGFAVTLVDFDCGATYELPHDPIFGGTMQAIDLDSDGDRDILASMGLALAVLTTE